jgi:Tol biopolymer transport system component
LAAISAGNPVRIVGSDGSIEGQFACGPNCKYEVARWSKDGTKLALEGTLQTDVFGVSGAYSILHTVNADGTSLARVDSAPASCTGSHGSCSQINYAQFDPDWSGDGRLVYTRGDSVITAAADGSNKKMLFGGADYARQPRWGPGDQTITFVRYVSGRPSLFTMQSGDGSDLRGLGPVDVDSYGWSPDGLAILVETTSPPDWHKSLSLVQPSNGQSTELLRHPMNGFAWSPRGNEIAFASGDSLFVADMNGGLKYLFRGAVDEPAWSPNGRYIIVKGTSLDNEILEIDRSTGASRIIASGYGWIKRFSVKNSTSWNGLYFYFY